VGGECGGDRWWCPEVEESGVRWVPHLGRKDKLSNF
jgi:hypothetical protein